MKYLYYLALILVLCQCGSSKNALGSAVTQKQMKLYVDELNQLYTLKQNNTIVKYDREGQQLFEVSDNTLGPVNVLDVSNPLQILAFHKNFQIVKIFDRTLTLNSRIDLNNMNLFEIRTVASANDNRIWVFDELNQELLKIDKNGMIQGRNNDLRLRLKTNATPYRIIEFQNTVYLFDKVHGILIFNAFGEYISQRDFEHGSTFSYLEGMLFYKSPEGLQVYDLTTGELTMRKLSSAQSNGEGYHIVGSRLIFLENDTIQINPFK